MKVIGTKAAAQILGLSERRVRALIAEKKLRAHKVGRDYAIEPRNLRSIQVHGKSGRPTIQASKKSAKHQGKRR